MVNVEHGTYQLRSTQGVQSGSTVRQYRQAEHLPNQIEAIVLERVANSRAQGQREEQQADHDVEDGREERVLQGRKGMDG